MKGWKCVGFLASRVGHLAAGVTTHLKSRIVKDPSVKSYERIVREAPSATDTSLLGRVRGGDAAGWERLVTLYGSVVYGWARRAGLKPELAADVVQEVFASVARRIADFRRENAGDTFGGWLRTITQNKVVDVLRRESQQVRGAGGDAAARRLEQQCAEATQSITNTDTTGTDVHLVRRALELIRSEFEPRTFEAFWRIKVEEQSAEDVAKRLGISRGAVYVAVCRVLKRLRRELDGVAVVRGWSSSDADSVVSDT